jgi:hypothetical protein
MLGREHFVGRLQCGAKRLTQNGTGTVFGVISMSWAEAARFALVHQNKLLRDFSGFDSLVFCEDNEESSHGLD